MNGVCGELRWQFGICWFDRYLADDACLRGLLVLSQRAFTQLSRGDKQQQNQCPHCAHQHGKEWEQREGQI